MKKIISVLLSLIIIAGICTISVSAETEDYTPTIIVHGLSQSNVWLVDENGEYVLDDDGDKQDCFPCIADVGEIVKIALVPLLLTLVTQHDCLDNAIPKLVKSIFYMNICNIDGSDSKYSKLEEYPQSVAECTQEEKDTIYDFVPLKKYAEIAGEENLYYFAYNSFGNNFDTVDRLYKYIQMVKEETGSDKVNLVPISQGGTVANGLLEYYNGAHKGKSSVYGDIEKIIYIIPALDGSSIIGDVYNLNVTFFDADYLYNGFLEELCDESTAKWVEVALRILPDEVIEEILHEVVESLVNDVFRYSTNMWALCPSADYPSAAEKWLTGTDMSYIKSQTDAYYRAQLNSDANILKLIESGAKVFNIVDYDYPLYNIGNTWNTENADGVIDTDSTSMGATFANIGETLPEGYTQACTYCSDPTHNHISPERVVDASTGLLPDTTFYFKNQGHESTASNDVIMTLASYLMAYDTIENVYSDPNFPQFNYGRNTKGLINDDIPNAKKVDRSTLTDGQATRLDAAIENAEKIIASTVVVPGEAEAAQEELRAILREIGVYGADDDEEDNADTPAAISSWLLGAFGTNGFSEYPVCILRMIFSPIINFFTE